MPRSMLPTYHRCSLFLPLLYFRLRKDSHPLPLFTLFHPHARPYLLWRIWHVWVNLFEKWFFSALTVFLFSCTSWDVVEFITIYRFFVHQENLEKKGTDCEEKTASSDTSCDFAGDTLRYTHHQIFSLLHDHMCPTDITILLIVHNSPWSHRLDNSIITN